MIKISSRGFRSAEYALRNAPFNHPLGLMFAIAAYFNAEGIHIIIDSASPPRSALGGSSAAAVALVTAFLTVSEKIKLTPNNRKKIALLAHTIEESVAGVPCGRQDQLAAAFGGINIWHWVPDHPVHLYKKEPVFSRSYFKEFQRHILLAYCGAPHASKDVNGIWVKQFLEGRHRNRWKEIIHCTKKFIDALIRNNYKGAAAAMNEETAHRRKMTPEVLDEMGEKLVDTAIQNGCGARFTGAGGGGCIWAIGSVESIDRLKSLWEKLLAERGQACLLDTEIDTAGVTTI
jgi:D-glycero-alpha-D-manno-heptose-7-phosphate kinase